MRLSEQAPPQPGGAPRFEKNRLQGSPLRSQGDYAASCKGQPQSRPLVHPGRPLIVEPEPSRPSASLLEALCESTSSALLDRSYLWPSAASSQVESAPPAPCKKAAPSQETLGGRPAT